ncbi:RNA-dependent RNA polymerase, putative [Ophiostoma mitovirus 5]|uniref:RNA-dependent RNA polymerase, putative n=1 Tax=Ophiostoma mitovirus 5 TaxID=88388 RepID=Q9WJ23_9VIRU|nr:RNA-dependent RNA polymerase, putative [Ophiostoma mitovirus 5]CAB42653.1 RNA-dependent RNA polymerase, putative [Ophiostoma mitovirus 5]
MKKINKTIKILLSIYFNRKYSSYGIRWIVTVERMRKINGLKFTIKYMKAVKLHITKYIANERLLSISGSRVSVDKDGFPTKFNYIKHIIDSGDIDGIRFVMTLLTYTRAINPTKKEYLKIFPDYSTITNEFTGSNKIAIPNKIIKEFVDYYKLANPNNNNNPELQWSRDDHYLSFKSSPNGQSTLHSSYGLFSMIFVGHTILENILKIVGEKQYHEIIGNHIKKLYHDHRLFIPGKIDYLFGKISIVKDPELKMRVIAMVDYHSQFVLKKIHNSLFNKLKLIKSDRTFTQDPIFTTPTMGHRFWSMDLSAATDRFPIDLQERLLSYLYGSEISSAWKQLLIDRTYKTPEGDELHYKVGQPMGAYSSWAAFTLTHHLVVFYSARMAGIKDFTNYILLGDDIVINNDKVAKYYIRTMKRLGVELSMNKTHVSKNTYEFAKRWFKNKKEITGLPLRGILNNLNNYGIVFQELFKFHYKYPHLTNVKLTDIMFIIFKGLKIKGRIITNSQLRFNLMKINFLLRYINKLVNFDETRLFYTKFIKSEDISMVNEHNFLDFTRGMLKLGLTQKIENSVKELKTFYDDVLKNSFISNIENKNDLQYEPLINGLYNKMLIMRNSIDRIVRNKDFDIIDAMNDMRLDNPEAYLEKIKNSNKPLSNLNDMFNTAKKRIKEINEYNSEYFQDIYDFDNFSNFRPYESYYRAELSTQIDNLDMIRGAYWRDPQKETEMLQYW